MCIKILLVDDHRVIREGLRSLIDKQPNMEVVGEAGDGRTAVQLALELAPDIVLMDVTMPVLNGIDATRQIVKECPKVKVLGLSIHSDKQFISYMLKAGASGYLLKNCAFEELVDAIQAVMSNHSYLSSDITSIVVDDYVNHLSGDRASPCSVLSRREREVLQLMAEGMSTKEVASSLNINGKTVATHRESIMRKLNIRNVVELAKYAVRAGLTSFDLVDE